AIVAAIVGGVAAAIVLGEDSAASASDRQAEPGDRQALARDEAPRRPLDEGAATYSDVTSLATATASTTLPRSTITGSTFVAANPLDGDPTTSWQPAARKRSGRGESLCLTFPRPLRFSSLELANGYQHTLGE